MNRALKRALWLGVGWLLVLLGFAGLLLPLPAMPLLLVGLVILSSEYVWAHHLLTKLRARFAKVSPAGDRVAERASVWLDRIGGGEGA